MKLSRMQVLAPDELSQIHQNSLAILEQKGVLVQSPSALDFLSRREGVVVDISQSVARFEHGLVTELLKSVPSLIRLFDRRDNLALTLGGEDGFMINGHCAPYTYDAATRQRRPMKLFDVEENARLADALPAIGVVGIQGTPQDVEPGEAFRWGACASLRHSDKPFHYTPETSADNRAVLEMVRLLSGSSDPGEKPSVLVQHTPISPLCWPGDIADMLLENARQGIPMAIVPAPYSGVSGPYPLAAQLALVHAEALSGVAMAQLVRPGTPVVWGDSCATCDLQSMQVLIGTPEASLLRVASAQLARSCALPSMTTCPDTDAYCPDQQAAWEKFETMFSALAAGTHLVCNAGMFSTGMTVCPEQLLMDAEMFLICRRLLEGIAVNPATLAQKDVLEIAHGGMFVGAESTLQFLRSGEHKPSALLKAGSFGEWLARGSQSVFQAATAKVRERLDRHPLRPEDPQQRKALEACCR